MASGYIHSIESFGAADGPGVRCVIFTSGCDMRCKFCHNPDTWQKNVGTLYTARELLDKAMRFKSYWGKDGGITLSGGEPLLQMDFATEFFTLAQQNGVNTVLDTSGEPFTKDEAFLAKFNALMQCTSLVMLDIKHIDNDEHIKLTGKPNTNILEMARYLSDINKPVWIRHVLVPGGSDNDVYLHQLADFIKTLKNVKRVEVLPYHTLGVFKWQQLGIPYALNGVNPPTQQRIDNAKNILNAL